MHLYRIRVVHELLSEDTGKPLAFCQWFMSSVMPDGDELDDWFWSDEASHSSRVYHNQMKMSNYMKWIGEKLLPNLPKESKSVLVTDASYHNVLIEKAPTSNSIKSEMISWLNQKRTGFCESFLKPQLYEIIKSNKQRFARYLLDDMLEKEGHNVLRLPPNHPDLNKVEMIWAEVKQYIRNRNTEFKIERVKSLFEEQTNLMRPKDWILKCDQIIDIENEYRSREPFIDNALKSFIIRDSDSDIYTSSSDESLIGFEEI
ncbi:uncharacterized protein LOC142328322 [Lycorma delicatula]|uniref:uncharacterized protein LOC142328322 n=1 Tax=Lycorma delicatula TaxID=130591 RepID=UPI003F518A35